jgi:hypothetical protein
MDKVTPIYDLDKSANQWTLIPAGVEITVKHVGRAKHINVKVVRG